MKPIAGCCGWGNSPRIQQEQLKRLRCIGKTSTVNTTTLISAWAFLLDWKSYWISEKPTKIQFYVMWKVMAMKRRSGRRNKCIYKNWQESLTAKNKFIQKITLHTTLPRRITSENLCTVIMKQKHGKQFKRGPHGENAENEEKKFTTGPEKEEKFLCRSIFWNLRYVNLNGIFLALCATKFQTRSTRLKNPEWNAHSKGKELSIETIT